MNVSFEGFAEELITLAAEDIAPGDLVSINEDGAAQKAQNGEPAAGLVRSVRGGFAGVQVKGYACVAVSGEVSPGWQTLVCDGQNGLKTGSGGRQLLVLGVRDGRLQVLLG